MSEFIVYISSTVVDLGKERSDAARIAGEYGRVLMTRRADDVSTVEACLSDVRNSSVYIGIIGMRYGWQPPANNPSRKSITELEYDACEPGPERPAIPRYVFVKEGPIDLQFVDEDRSRIDAFRRKVRSGISHTAFPFDDASDDRLKHFALQLDRALAAARRKFDAAQRETPDADKGGLLAAGADSKRSASGEFSRAQNRVDATTRGEVQAAAGPDTPAPIRVLLREEATHLRPARRRSIDAAAGGAIGAFLGFLLFSVLETETKVTGVLVAIALLAACGALAGALVDRRLRRIWATLAASVVLTLIAFMTLDIPAKPSFLWRLSSLMGLAVAMVTVPAIAAWRDRRSGNAAAYRRQISADAKPRDAFLLQTVDTETVNAYTQWKFPGLPQEEQILKLFLRDIDKSKYRLLQDIDQIVEQGAAFNEWFRATRPERYAAGIDYLTKAFGYVDPEFRKKHPFAADTRAAFQDFDRMK